MSNFRKRWLFNFENLNSTIRIIRKTKMHCDVIYFAKLAKRHLRVVWTHGITSSHFKLLQSATFLAQVDWSNQKASNCEHSFFRFTN